MNQVIIIVILLMNAGSPLQSVKAMAVHENIQLVSQSVCQAVFLANFMSFFAILIL